MPSVLRSDDPRVGRVLLSIEFQQTGYFVYRLYKSSYGRVPLLAEFAGNLAIGQGVIVDTAGWEARLAASKQ